MQFKFWPSTLAVQLILVTSVAMTLSNIAVAFWFEYDNQRQIASAANERALDRAASVATTLAAIPQVNHHLVITSMSGRLWKFALAPVPKAPLPMTADERFLARKLREMLPRHIPNQNLTSVQANRPLSNFPSDSLPPHSPGSKTAIYAVVPIDTHTMLVGTFVRPPQGLPVEIFVAAIAAIIAAGFSAALVARRVVRPLSELTEAAASMAAGHGTAHVNEEGPADVRNAAAAFNLMAAKVSRTLESQRHLLSAVGHDLRTPLTAMRINLEFVRDAELRGGLMRNLDELQALTEQVLAAAKGAGGEQRRTVDLAALVESLCADLDEIGEPVHWVNHGPAPISCRPGEIKRAVRNLVENAVAYGHKAQVSLIDTGDGYDVLVEDEGPGIPESDWQRVFEPFVRLEQSRNAGTGGTGLGLTLVKTIAEGHDGAVILANRQGGGLSVRLHLPRPDLRS